MDCIGFFFIFFFLYKEMVRRILKIGDKRKFGKVGIKVNFGNLQRL